MTLHLNPPPTAPAAPVDSGLVEVYAKRDVSAERGGKTFVVHREGTAQRLPYAVARELVATQPDDYTLERIEGVVLPSGPPVNVPLTPAAGRPAPFDLTTLPGVTDAQARKLRDAGLDTPLKLALAGPEELERAGLGAKMAEKIRGHLREADASAQPATPPLPPEMVRAAAEPPPARAVLVEKAPEPPETPGKTSDKKGG